MDVNIAELRAALDTVLAHLVASGHETVRLDSDYYWFVPKISRHDPYQEPSSLTLGQLTDDWAEIKKIHDGSADPVAYSLVWLSSILREVGEKLVS
jgi:hypothetical protein